MWISRGTAIFMACGKQDSLLKQNQKFADLLTELKIDHVFEIGIGSGNVGI